MKHKNEENSRFENLRKNFPDPEKMMEPLISLVNGSWNDVKGDVFLSPHYLYFKGNDGADHCTGLVNLRTIKRKGAMLSADTITMRTRDHVTGSKGVRIRVMVRGFRVGVRVRVR